MERWSRGPQIGVAAIQPLLAALGARDVDPAAFCAKLDVDPAIAADPDGRVPIASLDAIWNRAAELTGDPHLGLHAAQSVCPDSFGLLSYLGASCPTWGDGIRTVCRYFRLLSEASAYHLAIEGDRAILTATQDVCTPEPVRQRVEFTVAVMHRYGQRFVADWHSCDVFLEHRAPDDCDEHLRMFGRAPRFEAGASGFAFPVALLDSPLETSEPRLAAVLERLASRLVADMPQRSSMAQRVRADLLRVGLDGDVSLEGAAGRLGMSPRTLQRRLRNESTSHGELVDELRRAVAIDMLTASDTAIAEVAYAVGFSEPAAFHRAFKRWTGRTPSEFRRGPARRP